MFLRLFLLFTLVPLLDLILLVWINGQTNWIVTLALIFVPGILGAWLARHQGLRCLREVRQQMGRGEIPAASLLDGLMILLAAALLITPGLITDTAGLLLLVPPVRRVVRHGLVHYLRARYFVMVPRRPGAEPEHRDKIIDVRVIDPKQKSPD